MDDKEQMPQTSTSALQQEQHQLQESVRILLEPRKKGGLLHRSKSEGSLRLSPTTSCSMLDAMESDISLETSHSCISMTSSFQSTSSYGSSLSNINSARLIASQTSSYTTESSYQTATAGSSSSFLPQQTLRNGNFLREIHLGIESTATSRHIEIMHEDLRGLLSHEIDQIRQASDGTRLAIYIIAYQYM